MTGLMMAQRLPQPELLAADAALFIDLDGTLEPIRPRPENVGPRPWRSRLLSLLRARLNGRLAVISGRTLEDVDRILEGAAPAVAAVHGLVRRRADGRIEIGEACPGLHEARRVLADVVAETPGLALEDKGLGLALHFRTAPELAERAASAAAACARRTGLTLQLGDMVAEVRAPGLDKGGAVERFMDEAPFRGSWPVFVGDDLTDEDGFRAAQALGGTGVLVGSRRPTCARRGLRDVQAVRRWLSASLDEAAA